MSYLVVDTDVASGILRQRLSGSLRGQLLGQTLAITFVTLGELTKWTLVRQWGLGDHPLATLNVKDFADSAAHDGLQLIS